MRANQGVAAAEARDVLQGTCTHPGAPSFLVVLPSRPGFAAERQVVIRTHAMLKNLTPAQAELERYMSDLSEEAYCAGWMQGLEYALWEVVLGELGEYGRLVLSQEHRMRLRNLSQACGGWIVFDDESEETWIPTAEWEQRFSAWRKQDGRHGSGG